MQRHEWDARKYQNINQPQIKSALYLIDLIKNKDYRTILDAGCGVGNVTAILAEKFSSSKIYAVDRSENMLEVAREKCKGIPNIDFSLQDLSHLKLNVGVDLVFSNMVIHWIDDHPKLYTNLFNTMNSDADLIASYPCKGTLPGVTKAVESTIQEEPFRKYFKNYQDAVNMKSIEETQEILQHCGFRNINVGYKNDEIKYETRLEYRKFCEAVLLNHPLKFLEDPTMKNDFIDRFVDRMTEHDGYKFSTHHMVVQAQK